MNFQSFFNFGNNRDRGGNFQTAAFDTQFSNATPGQIRREINRSLQENQNSMLKEATNRIAEQAREQRRRQRPRRTGATRLSNTDSIGRANQIRARLLAKLQEIHGSDMEDRARGAASMDIKLQLNRVEQQIAAIRRRERAIQQERNTPRREDTVEARRRRARDMQERRIYIRTELLYHANEGGWDPNNPLGVTPPLFNPSSPVAFDFDGNAGTMDIAAGAEFNVEVML